MYVLLTALALAFKHPPATPPIVLICTDSEKGDSVAVTIDASKRILNFENLTIPISVNTSTNVAGEGKQRGTTLLLSIMINRATGKLFAEEWDTARDNKEIWHWSLTCNTTKPQF